MHRQQCLNCTSKIISDITMNSACTDYNTVQHYNMLGAQQYRALMVISQSHRTAMNFHGRNYISVETNMIGHSLHLC